MAASVDPHPKLCIQKKLFVPFEVLVAVEQGKSIHHYLKNSISTPVSDPKLCLFYPRLNFDTWSEGLNISMYIWTEVHPEDAHLLMHYNQIVRNMAKVFPLLVSLGYDREVRILHQQCPSLPWNILHFQIYFQQLAKASLFGFEERDAVSQSKDRGGVLDPSGSSAPNKLALNRMILKY